MDIPPLPAYAASPGSFAFNLTLLSLIHVLAAAHPNLDHGLPLTTAPRLAVQPKSSRCHSLLRSAVISTMALNEIFLNDTSVMFILPIGYRAAVKSDTWPPEVVALVFAYCVGLLALRLSERQDLALALGLLSFGCAVDTVIRELGPQILSLCGRARAQARRCLGLIREAFRESNLEHAAS